MSKNISNHKSFENILDILINGLNQIGEWNVLRHEENCNIGVPFVRINIPFRINIDFTRTSF